jgi:sugar transferase (PEP-CTERM system associated)
MFFNTSIPVRILLLGISEVCLVMLAFVAAMMARLGTTDASIELSYEQGFLKIGVIAATFVICMYYFDLYDSSVLGNRREVLARLIQVLGTVSALLAFVYYVYPPLKMGRGIFLVGLLFVALLLLGCRRLFLVLNSIPQLADRTLILGDGPLATALLAELEWRRELGLNVVGQVCMDDSGNASLYRQQSKSSAPFERTQVQVNLLSAADDLRIGRIIVAMGERRGKLPVETLLQLKSKGIRIQDGVEVYETATGKIPLQSLRLSWLLFSPGFQISRPMIIYKRLSSIVFSFLGIILTLPLMILISLLIRVDSPGPAIFRQKRIGQDGKVFTLYKFRSMVDGADQDNWHRPAERTDSRFTRVGGLLRRTRLDELPQLFNIFRGDMNFVGPRPFVPNQEYECLQKIPYYRQRWVITPGATGWAQVNRGYNVTIEDNTDKLAYDLFYIKNMSIGLDLLILIKTAKILLLGRGSQ